MFCWDGGSCHDRYQTRPYFMSSKSWASKMAQARTARRHLSRPHACQGGIFDSDAEKSGFGNSNRVYVKYCSSDLWMGDVAASDATFGFAFRGQRIANAVVAALVQKHGMSSGARLLFGGCSAGAIGAMLNLDVIADSCAALGIEVRGLLDAAALVDIYPTGWPWSPDLTPLQTLMAQLVALLRPPLPEACVRAGLAGDATWKCFFSAYRMPLLATPFFANAVQFDDFELQYDTDNLGPSTPAQFAFVDSFQPAFLDLIAALPPGTGVYSPTCLVHCLSGQPTFADFLTNGVSMSAALSDWYFGDQPTSVVSPCQGFSCTSACGVNVHGLPCNLDGAGDSCQPVQLPTSEPNEPAPATSDAPLQLPSEVAVQDSEQSLTTDQQSQLSAVLMQQGPSGSPPGGFQLRLSAGRKMLETKAALITCCGN